MSDNVERAVAFFDAQFTYWSSHGGVEGYFRAKNRKTLAEEFSRDPAFASVCSAFKEISELQLRSDIATTAEGLVWDIFKFPVVGSMDVIIGGIADACGEDTIGDKLLKAGAIAIVTAALLAFLTAAFKGYIA